MSSTRSARGSEGRSMSRNKMLETRRQLPVDDSVKRGRDALAKLIAPIPVAVFLKQVWEKRPLYVSRNNASYFEYVCTMQDFKNALQAENILFGENLDVCNYVNGVKRIRKLKGRATPKLAWDMCKKGYSIRLLNPQTFIPKVTELTTTLQEYFRSFVGSNIYITPGTSQGFAPHYDDVEAFALQLAGRKEWRIYKPREGENLARFSSKNFSEKEIGIPILKVIMEPGDLLYFPRGFIHQAKTLEEGSMHITVSCYQRNTWADFLEKLLPVALQTAINEDSRYRKGMPLSYLDELGMIYSEKETRKRKRIITHLQRLVKNLIEHLPIDGCADQFGKDFMRNALPPVVTEDEEVRMARGDCTEVKEKLLQNKKNLKFKLLRAYACRLVCEDKKFRLFYCTKNSLKYQEGNQRSMPMSSLAAVLTENLMKRYPIFTSLQELQSIACKNESLEAVASYVEKMCKKGLILFNKPLTDD